jgi:hypothetical protein
MRCTGLDERPESDVARRRRRDDVPTRSTVDPRPIRPVDMSLPPTEAIDISELAAAPEDTERR